LRGKVHGALLALLVKRRVIRRHTLILVVSLSRRILRLIVGELLLERTFLTLPLSLCALRRTIQNILHSLRAIAATEAHRPASQSRQDAPAN
jgi:hypothetical protein